MALCWLSLKEVSSHGGFWQWLWALGLHHHTNKCKWCYSNFSGLRLVPDNVWSHSTEAHSTHFQRPGASVSQCRWGSKTRPVTLRWAGKQQMLHPAWLRGPRGGHRPSGLLARIRTAQTFSLMWFLAKSYILAIANSFLFWDIIDK